MNATYQLFPDLNPDTYNDLHASIKTHGVTNPVIVDQHGNIIDGHHRVRICTELGIAYPTETVHVENDTHARQLAETLNVDRRHLTDEERLERRRANVAELRADGHSERSISKALGVPKTTIRRDIESIGPSGPMPDRVQTSDGRTYPARRPTRTEISAALQAEDPDRDEDDVADEAQAILDTGGTAEEAIDSRRLPITKPDLGGGISHPARYSDELIPHFADLLGPNPLHVLDPFAGTGRIHQLQQHGHTTIGIEIEPEWANLHPDTTTGSALDLPYPPSAFDAICTSPTYGNRLADNHNATDPHLRRSYTHDLGRPLHQDNSGDLQWGDNYRQFHIQAWAEAIRVLKPGGLFILNIKDHIRGGRWMDVAGWHTAHLTQTLTIESIRPVITGHLKQGANSELRVPAELIITLRKPAA